MDNNAEKINLEKNKLTKNSDRSKHEKLSAVVSRSDDGIHFEDTVVEDKEKREGEIAGDPIIEITKKFFAEDSSNYPSSYRKSEALLSVPVHIAQVWNEQVSFLDNLYLDLLGASFNGYNNIYLLASERKNKQLYICRYDYKKNEFSEFKHVANLTEEIYEAVLYKETEKTLNWYLLGKKTIWQLSLSKPELSNFSGDFSLIAFYEGNYSNETNDVIPDHEGGTLIVFNQLPWIIGGKRVVKNILDEGKDASRRLLMVSSCVEKEKASEVVNRVRVNEYFLNQNREAPISYIYGQSLICIGGNTLNKEHISEFFDLSKVLVESKDHHQVCEKSILCLEDVNFAINTQAPRAASCLYNNAIFIFTDKIFSEKDPMYYKYDFLSRGATSSGNNTWQFPSFENNFSYEDLKFKSAKSIAVSQNIYLILFNLEEDLKGTNIKVFKIPV